MSGVRDIARLAWRQWVAAGVGARTIATRLRFLGQPIEVLGSSWVARTSRLEAAAGGRIRIGARCEIHPHAMILAYGGAVTIGDDCSVNPFAVLYGHGGLTIGNGVRIATHVVMIPANHNPATEGVSLSESGLRAQGIRIDDDVWIGAGARILDGVHIGRRAVVGAGSVVTRSVAPDMTVAGVPARPLNTRREK